MQISCHFANEFPSRELIVTAPVLPSAEDAKEADVVTSEGVGDEKAESAVENTDSGEEKGGDVDGKAKV